MCTQSASHHCPPRRAFLPLVERILKERATVGPGTSHRTSHPIVGTPSCPLNAQSSVHSQLRIRLLPHWPAWPRKLCPPLPMRPAWRTGFRRFLLARGAAATSPSAEQVSVTNALPVLTALPRARDGRPRRSGLGWLLTWERGDSVFLDPLHWGLWEVLNGSH